MAEKKIKKNNVFVLVISVVTLLALLAAATFSWFITTKYAIVNTTHVGVLRSPTLSIRDLDDPDGQWKASLELDELDEIEPSTGDGVKFFSAGEMDYDQYITKKKYPDIGTSEEETIEIYKKRVINYRPIDSESESFSKYVIKRDFQIRYSASGNVLIDPSSTLLPAADAANSIYMTDVSTGLLAGALRVGISELGEDGAYHLRVVWIPNPTYEFDISEETFTQNGNVEDSYCFTKKADGTDPITINTAEHPGGWCRVGDVLYVWDLSNCREPFTTVSGSADPTFRLTIWLEGTDRECVYELAAGQNESGGFVGGKTSLKLGLLIS